MPTPAAAHLLACDDPKPLYYRLKEILKREMEQDFQPHQKFYSIRELVRRHGVSSITVTRALRELVDEGLLYARQGKGTFVQPRKQQGRPTQQGLTISLPMNESFGEVLLEPSGIRKDYLRGIADAGREYGAVVEFQLVPHHQVTDFFLNLINRNTPHGVILYGSRDPNYPRLIERAIDRHVPYVAFQPERCFTWDQVQKLNFHYVTTDQQDGLRQATAHLINLGHRRIAYWQHIRTGFTRYEGFRQAMRMANLNVDPQWVKRDFDFNLSSCDALRELVRAGVTALVTASDYIAMQVLHDAREAGIDVPDQLSVTGFDDNLLAATQMPPLTTVAIDRYLTGRAIVTALIHQFRQPESTQKQQVVVPVELVVRESTAAISKSS